MNLFGSSQNTNGERKIITRTFFPQISGRHIDDDLFSRNFITVVLKCCGNSKVALLYCIIRKSDQMIPDTVINIHFNGNGSGLDPKNGTAENFFEHNGLVLLNVGRKGRTSKSKNYDKKTEKQVSHFTKIVKSIKP